MSTLTQNDGSDQIDDLRARETFICSLCGFEFSEEKYLRNHFKHCQDVENPADRLGAAIVENEDRTTELEQRHEFDETVTSNETFDLKIEDMICTEYTVSGFNGNVSDPPMEGLEEYKAQSTELEEHTKIHTGGNPYVSNGCDFVGTRMGKNTDNKPFKCSICDYAVARKYYLTDHMKTHTGDKPFKCSRCDYAFARKYHLTSHMTTHTGDKPFKCTLCDYACAKSTNLTSHMRRHAGKKPFKCAVCDYACAESARLKSHMRSHTGEKPFKCTLCDYACAKSTHLTTHMRRHTGEKPFKCTLCDYASAESATKLKSHMRSHTGEKPFKCTLCDYACAISYSLRCHMRTHTGYKP